VNNPIAVCLDRNPFPTVDDLVAAAAGYGFDRIEWFEKDAEAPWSNPATSARLRELMRRHGLTAQYHAPYEGPAGDLTRDGVRFRAPGEIAALLSSFMDRAERLGAKLMTVHLGSCPAGEDRAEALRCALEGLRLAVPELRRRGIRAALENHTTAIIDSALGDRPEEFDWLLAGLPPEWIGMTFDLGHACINGHLDEFLERPLDRVFNMHLHDNDGTKDAHLPLGRGIIDWAGVLRRIAGQCYGGTLTLEFFAGAEDYHNSMALLRRA
jgi:sugar phosphate isomerase/epimerase